MLTGRAFAVLAAGLLLWIGSRVAGSPGLHIVALGLVLLVPLSWITMRTGKHRLVATRRFTTRRAHAGARVRVSLEVENPTRSRTPLLMLEDRLPPALGRGARAVLGGIPAGERQSISYVMTCSRRGRYRVGPLTATLTDPLGLAKVQLPFPERHELVVYPEVEDLRDRATARSTGGAGETTARQLYRTGEDFYTMREYEMGDDLRRIHWRSTARTGTLMIRQDEAARRASVTVVLDTRAEAFGGSLEAFERGVSAAASIGTMYLRQGTTVRLATSDSAPRRVTTDGLLEALAVVGRATTLAATPLTPRDAAPGGSSLVLVTGPPSAGEVPGLLRGAAPYPHRLAILITHRTRKDGDPARATTTTLQRAGWEVLILPPGGSLRDAWNGIGSRAITTAARS
ncbi:MAG TPA: DUF58 domain-containing protein [Actinomycetota bacterium]